MLLRVALFEAATIVSAAVAVVPVAIRVVQSWLANRRKRAMKITVTLSDGDELKISNVSPADIDKIVQFFAKVKVDELEALDGSPPGEESQ